MRFTGERAMEKVFLGKKRFADHYERYKLAKNYCEGKICLDVASGSGYGSLALSKVALQVYGLDISEIAIEYCRQNLRNNNLTFVLGDGKNIPFENNSFDVVVSFETIEHIRDYAGFLTEIKRVLKRGGLLIMSTPNFKGEIWKNKWHVSNFHHKQFIATISEYFTIEKELFQGKRFYPFPGRGVLETLFGIKRDIEIHNQKPIFDHHVSIVIAKNTK